MIATSHKIPSKLIYSSPNVEMIAVEISVSPPLIICCLYIPPSSPEPYITEVLSALDHLPYGHHTIILGDLNLPSIDWSTLSASSHLGTLFCEKIFSLNMLQLVNKPTHTHGNILDVVIATHPDQIHNLKVHDSISNSRSDHYLITLNTIISKPTTQKISPRKIFLYSKADLSSLSHHLSLVNNPLAYITDINNGWSQLKSLIVQACHTFIPQIKLCSYPSPRWFNSDIRHALNRLHTLRRLTNRKPTEQRLAKLSSAESALQVKMESAKHVYEANLIKLHHSNPKKLYNHLKYLSKGNSASPPLIIDSQPVTSPSVKAQTFNNFFNSVFTRSNFILPPIDNLPSPSLQISSITIKPNDVSEALSSLDPSKASGCDNVSPYVLRHCAIPLTSEAFKLFSHSISTSSLPDEWKIHKIIPVFKNGDKSCVNNYRPISLLCVLSKALESIIHKKIIPFIRPLISHHQFGFLKNRSCLSQLLTSFSEIFTSIESGGVADVLYLDFKKAFDTVPHNELLFKLWSIGITGPLWLWFKNYLSGRSHYVDIDGVSSTLLPVISGIPQGSILGPLLFLIYINDLPDAICFSSTYLFADDTKLIHAVSSFQDHSLQSDIDSLMQWCATWKLTPNLSKSSCTRFALSDKGIPIYQMNGNPINHATNQRDLGVLISSDLSCQNHLSYICSNAYRSLNFIRRSMHSQSPSTNLKRCLYITLIRSKLSYCSQLWRPHLIKHIKMLENIQRRATKFITLNHEADYKQRLIQSNLLPLMYWLELQDILFLVKCLQNPSDNFNIRNFVTFTSSCTRSTSSNKLRYNYCRSTTTRHFYFNRIVRLWNALPQINLSLPYINIKKFIYSYFWNHFTVHFNPTNPCSFHYLCPCSICHLSKQ